MSIEDTPIIDSPQLTPPIPVPVTNPTSAVKLAEKEQETIDEDIPMGNAGKETTEGKGESNPNYGMSDFKE
ncbi:hypothetical protein DXG01_006455 [Tephrocybe rancida]|nr:hypothetical protein DXG01_006455 [Tephrocybe rancida]